MLIIGAKGLAREVLEVCKNLEQLKNLVFYDDINLDKDILYGRFPILHKEEEVVNYFKDTDVHFVLGFGAIEYRVKLNEKFIALGGEPTSLLSPKAMISTIDVHIGQGCVVMPGVVISNGVKIGRECLVYFNSILTHDVTVGAHSIISPGATLLGRVTIGERCFIGANATVLPDVTIGDDVVVGAGAVVTRDVKSQLRVVGNPARNI